MPTGYTAKIYDGKEVTAKEFIVDCSRAFGAMIMMRDEPAGAQIPERFEPSEYAWDRAKSLKLKLAQMQLESEDEVKTEYESWYRNHCESEFRRYQESVEREKRYLSMIEKVEKWEPPTEEHVELKKFSLQQLRDSWNADCSHNPNGYIAPDKPSFEKWKSDRVENLHREISYYEKSYLEEVDRTEERNRWIREQRESLKGFEL